MFFYKKNKLYNILLWFYIFRIYTLPLSLSSIIISSSIIFYKKKFNIIIFIYNFLINILYQILVNISNDYGDFIKGVDNNYKKGIKINLKYKNYIKKIIIFLSIFSFILSLIFFFLFKKKINFFLFGSILCIFSSIKYTIGFNPYGYKGLGDLFVFIFFGVFSIQGSYFLYTNNISYKIILLSLSIGFLCVSILNLNNLRDINNDKKNKKYTLVVKIGIIKSKIYHFFLVFLPFFLSIKFMLFTNISIYNWFFIILFLPMFFHIKNVFLKKKIKYFNLEIRKIIILILFYSILIGLGIII
jgi:1,4-dihydroxy-2-naphthoate octaprenyltransferase